jgi:2-polyprenyl-3-methyl-5-hydroxy-6-metoxy-1,4-benzoquinol methylase
MAKCLVCGKSGRVTVIKKKSFLGLPVAKCVRCGLIFTDLSKTGLKKKLAEYYAKDFWISQKRVGRIRERISEWMRSPMPNLKITLSYIKEGRVRALDIGCGKGRSLFLMENMGFETCGVEPDKEYAAALNKSLGRKAVYNTTVEKLRTNKKFDFIYLNHSLEHMAQPDRVLLKIKKLLSKEGVLFVEVPNCANKKVLDCSIDSAPHLYHFTRATLGKMLKDAGLNIIKLQTYKIVGPQKRNLPRLLCYSVLFNFSKKWTARNITISRESDNENGDVIVAIAG